MDIFTQRKLLIRIVIILTVLNMVLIALMLTKDLFRKQPPGETLTTNRDVSAVLKRELNLSREQEDRIRILRSSYFKTEEALAEIIKGERDSINMIMFNKSTDEQLVRSLARRIAENDYKMELLRFEQAMELKSICTPEQLEKFNELIIDIRDYFRHGNRPQQKPQPNQKQNREQNRNQNQRQKPPRQQQ
jgi:Spy/CpxP family protein refolding chaperone